jgi:hypothetical protein
MCARVTGKPHEYRPQEKTQPPKEVQSAGDDGFVCSRYLIIDLVNYMSY